MIRVRQGVLMLASSVVLAACGSTVSGPVRDGSALPVTTDGAAAMDAGGGPGTPGVAPGTSTDGGQPAAPVGGVGSESSVSRGSGSGPTTTTARRNAPPLQIGVLVTDTDSFRASIGQPSSTGTTRDSIHAFINAINTSGGIAGRKLTVVDATMNFSAASFDTEFQAACQKFTADNHVGAVIYDAVVYNSVFNTCLTKAKVPAIYLHLVGTQVGDDTDLANYPGLITAGSVSIDRRLRAIVHGALAHGFLRSGSKLGVLVENCPYHARAYDRTLAPLLARNKITTAKYDFDCGTGSVGNAQHTGVAEAAVLQFKTAGVDTVMYVTNYENGVAFYFGAAAESQQYRPQYLLFHNQGAAPAMDAWKGQGFGAQLEKMRGFGVSPIFDVTHPPSPPPAQAAARQACLATARSRDIPTADLLSLSIVFDTCDAVNLLRRALTLSGGEGGTRAVVSAVERLGTAFVSTMVLNGATRFGVGHHDGAEMGAVSVYQAKCECIAYITRPTPIP